MKSYFKHALICYGLLFDGFVYASGTSVSSQGGPLGVTSISSNNADVDSSVTKQKNVDTSAPLTDKEMFIRQQKLVEQMVSKLDGFEKQVDGLKSELRQVKSRQHRRATDFITYNSRSDSQDGQNSKYLDDESSEVSMHITNNISEDGSIIDMNSESLGGVFDDNGGIDVGGQPVITSGGQVSFMGSYSGNNSIPIGQISSSLFSSTLLGQREKFDDYSIFFGGMLQADAQAWSGSPITTRDPKDSYGATGQNIYLTTAQLFFLSNLGHYVTAQFDFIANENNDFFLGNAYAIFGNLDTSPFFVTAGRSPLSVGGIWRWWSNYRWFIR